MFELEEIEAHIRKLESNQGSSYFHGLVSYLATLLDFKKKEHWYEADPYNVDPTQFSTLPDLRLADSISFFRNYAYRVKHTREQEYLISTTNHPSMEHLESGLYVARSIMANSTLGLEKRILQYNQVRREFPQTATRDSLSLAFDNDCIVQLKDHFFLHAKFLYELVKKK